MSLVPMQTAAWVLAQLSVAAIVVVAIVVLVVLWTVGVYNGLVRRRNHVDESWSDVDTELKRRYDLIPNLVETVKGYAAHERETLEAVIQARNAAAAPHATPGEQAQADNMLTGALRQLFAVAEQYPDLKANQNFMQLQGELSNTEDRIQRSRGFYNDNVRDYNIRVESFPANLMAGMFGFDKRDFFEIENPAAREAPKVQF
jgi:LemA protein